MWNPNQSSGLSRACFAIAVAAALTGPTVFLLSIDAPTKAARITTGTDAATVARVAKALARLPLSFELNRGQASQRVLFLSRGRGYTLFLTRKGAVLSLIAYVNRPKIGRSSRAERKPRIAALGVALEGVEPNAAVKGLRQLPGRANYFVGRDTRRWNTNIPTYAEVKYEKVYPGIDLIYRGSSQHQLEYDFVIGAGANPEKIELAFAGAEGLRLNPRGDLLIKVGGGEVVERAPVIYQPAGALRRPIAGGYVLRGRNRVGFKVAQYDRREMLVIDPQMVYSSYLSGNSTSYDVATGVAVDSSGNAYVSGYTSASDFPATAGALQGGLQGSFDAFVTKLNASGNALVYSTYLGGSSYDAGQAVAVDSAGSAYIAGETSSGDFPTTAGAFQTTLPGLFNNFVSKLNASGDALVYSTYLGGTFVDFANGVAVDSSGSAYVTGFTLSTNFPTTAGAFRTSYGSSGDAFVTKLNVSGNALVYSTYLGGSSYDAGQAVAVDASGNAYITGQTSSGDFPATAGAFQTSLRGHTNAFIAKLNAVGSALPYSTFLGGTSYDYGQAVAVDASGNAYVSGYTFSIDFPITGGAFQTTPAGSADAFVTKLNAAGSSPVYSTFVGGGSNDYGYGIAVDASGNAYVSGQTTSSNFPVTADALQNTLDGSSDAFLTTLNPSGSALVYSTFLGGSLDDIGFGVAVDSSGNAYVSGQTLSADFPVTAGAYQTADGDFSNAFVAKFAFLDPFADFNVKLSLTLSTGGFDLLATFVPGIGGVIDPATQNLALQTANYSLVLPAGTLHQQKNGGYVFQGVVGGVTVQVRLTRSSTGTYELQAQGSGADLSGIANPVTVVLTIGNGSGTAQVNADIM